MMEATTRNQRCWLLLFVYFASVFLYPIHTHAQTIPDPKLRQLLDSAEILKFKGRFNDAIQICEITTASARDINDWEILARSLNELAEINRHLGKYQICQNYLDQSKNIIVNHLDTLNHEMARNLFYQGRLIGNERDPLKGYPDNILKNYLHSENILRHSGNYPRELCYVLMVIARYYHNPLNQIDKAKKYYEELGRLNNESFTDLHYLRGYYFYYLGGFYYHIGDYERAILFSELSLHILGNPSNYDEYHILPAEINLANTYYVTRQIDNALRNYSKVIELAEKNTKSYYDELVVSHTNMGELCLSLNLLDSGIYYSNKALSLNRDQSKRDKLMKSYALLNLGKLYVRQNKYHDAEVMMHKSLNLIEKTHGKKDYYTHVISRYIGNYYEARGKLDDALNYYQRAIMTLFADFNSEDIFADPNYIEYENKEDIYYVLTDKSRALYQRYLLEGNRKDLEAAFKLYKTGYDLLDELLNTGYMDESMIQVFRGFKEAFNLSIECAFDLYQLSGDPEFFYQAFQFMEKSRYFLLFKAMSNTLFKETAGITDSLFIRERQLTHDIDQLKHQLNIHNDPNPEFAFSTRNSLVDKLLQKDAIWSQISLASSTGVIAFMDSIILSVTDIQHDMIQDNEIFIEYQWAENFIYALIIGKEKVDVCKIDITKELITHISEFAQSVSGNSDDIYEPEGYQRYILSAHMLFQEIFEPALKKLRNTGMGINSINQITIVPDGMLSYLPFEALLTAIPDTTTVSYWNLPYLLNDFTFRYAYSLNILRNNLTAKQKIKNPKLLAFSYSAILDDNPEITQLRSEQEIRYSAEELNSIKSKIKNGDFYEDSNATEKIFKDQAVQYSLLHLALHGQADISDKFNSKLIFKEGGTQEEDGELYAYELYNMDLSNTEMAVLSACETGIGQQTEGEGIFSIARGFAYAGCPSIFMSLWKVSDKTTALLMDHFYTCLIKGMPKDQAMQKAKIAYIDQAGDYGSHPSHWAAFIAMGNNNPIHTPKSLFPWYYGIILLAIIFILAYVIHSRKKSPLLN